MKDLFLLGDDVGYAQITLNESNNDGKTRFRGKMQECNVVNKNRRLYPEHVLRREVERLAEDIKERGFFGELDHPDVSIVKFTNVSHLITKLWWEGNTLMGEGEVLPTPCGRILKNLLESGVRVGISSRGIGSGTTNADGILVINENFTLASLDIVCSPSTPKAFQRKITENYTKEIQNEIKINTNNVNNVNSGALVSYLGHVINQKRDEIKKGLR